MKLIFMLVFILLFGCGSPDTDPVLEEEVQQLFASELPISRLRVWQDYHRITDCMAVSWGLLIGDDNVYLVALVGNVCPYPIRYFAPYEFGAGNFVLRLSDGSEDVRWSYFNGENPVRKWVQIELRPGEVRHIGGNVGPRSGETWLEGINSVSIGWPRPGGSYPPTRDYDESSHILKTYRVEFTAEELEYLRQRFK